MSRIAERFAILQSAGRKALIPFVTAGHPAPPITVPLLHRLVAAGADVIELGVPFSDPVADGPVIQKAGEQALAQGMNLARILELVAEFRRTDSQTPLVLMGYLNPMEAMGHAEFARRAAAAGVDGVLTVDLPLEETDTLVPDLRAAGIDPIFLLAPTSSERRIQRTAELASGYVYYVSLKGVTGSGALDVAAVSRRLVLIRRHLTLPVGVGFGIKDAASAAAVGQVADAVVVGSALVTRMSELADDEPRLLNEVPALLATMRQALDRAA